MAEEVDMVLAAKDSMVVVAVEAVVVVVTVADPVVGTINAVTKMVAVLPVLGVTTPTLPHLVVAKKVKVRCFDF